MPIAFSYTYTGVQHITKEKERFITDGEVYYITTFVGLNGDFLVPTYSDGAAIRDEDLMFHLFEMNAALGVAEYIVKLKLPDEITYERLIGILKNLETAGKITRDFSTLLQEWEIDDQDLHLDEIKGGVEKGKTVTAGFIGITDLKRWADKFATNRDWESCWEFEAALGKIAAITLIGIGMAKAASGLAKAKKNDNYKSLNGAIVGVLPPSLAERSELRQGYGVLKKLLGYLPFDSVKNYAEQAERRMVSLLFEAKAKLDLENNKKNLLGGEHYFEKERGFVSRIFGFFRSLLSWKNSTEVKP